MLRSAILLVLLSTSCGLLISSEVLAQQSPAIIIQLPEGAAVQPGSDAGFIDGSIGVVELTVGECLALGGDVTNDNTCPETTTTGPRGGSIRGKFSCSVRGGPAACVNEDYAPQ
ncbi:MAG: hypothetical protein JWQ89_2556 [Devosia sp.]|nr:hypothetical protein [Devosia sp.]